MSEVFRCPLCAGPGEPLFTGFACERSKCVNYRKPEIHEEIRRALENMTTEMAWWPGP